jgi:hypothetical protein
MKNYLFAPFEDDAEKIKEFNYFKNYLSRGHRNSLIMFIGRLESYYDNIITELKAENTQSKFFLKGEQVNTDALCDEINESREHYEEEIAELKAEIKQLRADMAHDSEVCYDLDDKHVEIIKRLEVEKDALLVANGELLQSNLKLRGK